MNMHVSPQLNDEQRNNHQLPAALQEQRNQDARGFLAWWYRWTAPQEVPPGASLAQREHVRRGQLASTILLVMMVFLFAALPTAAAQAYHNLLFVLLPSLLISAIVLFLNRRGKITLAGIILVTGFEAGYVFSLLGSFTTTQGLGIGALPRLDLLIEPLLLAVSFLPPRNVFLVAFLNSIFIVIALTVMPHAAELSKVLATSPYTYIEGPIVLQFVVAIVSYLWVQSTNRAIERADRAETIAALEHTIAEQKKQLDAGIQSILQTHVQVANGDFTARTPLTRENVLWQIGVSLNNLLARLQRLSQTEYELHMTKGALKQTKDALQQSRQETARLLETLRQARGGKN